MESQTAKENIMRQLAQSQQKANVRQLIESMNEECYTKCITKPGTSLSSGEQACFTKCMEKYMAAWNQVNAAYIQRIKDELAREGGI